jgi:hypothetical protein
MLVLVSGVHGFSNMEIWEVSTGVKLRSKHWPGFGVRGGVVGAAATLRSFHLTMDM